MVSAPCPQAALSSQIKGRLREGNVIPSHYHFSPSMLHRGLKTPSIEKHKRVIAFVSDADKTVLLIEHWSIE
jgi:hypothetical protein